MLLQISTLKFWINLEPLDYFHLIGTARGGRSGFQKRQLAILTDCKYRCQSLKHHSVCH